MGFGLIVKLYKCIYQMDNETNSVGEITDGKICYYGFNHDGFTKHFNKVSNSLLDSECTSCTWFPLCRNTCIFENKDFGKCKSYYKDRLIKYLETKGDNCETG